MSQKCLYVFLLILFSIWIVSIEIAFAQVEIKNSILNVLQGMQYKFSSDEQSLENFSCDISFPMKEENIVFKILYKKNKFYKISCFNENGLEFLTITNDNICFINKGKYFCYLKKKMGAQFSWILGADYFTFNFYFKDGQDGFLIDVSEIASLMTANKQAIETKELNGGKDAIIYEFNFEKKTRIEFLMSCYLWI